MKKRTLSDVERAECAKLKAIYRAKAKALGLTQLKLADEFDMSQTAVSMYLNGINPLNLAIAARFSSILGVPVSEFSPRLASQIQRLAATGLKTIAVEEGIGNIAPALQPHRRMVYPLISWIAAGERAESPDNYHPGDGEEMLESTENAGQGGYWLTVKGQSMKSEGSPSFPDGIKILVRPEGFDVISGKYYVAKHRDGETTFKQYLRDAGSEYLVPLNPSFKTIEMDDEWRLIGRVIDAKLTGL
jgi:SOS-response transcriptional repressor LexA